MCSILLQFSGRTTEDGYHSWVQQAGMFSVRVGWRWNFGVSGMLIDTNAAFRWARELLFTRS